MNIWAPDGTWPDAYSGTLQPATNSGTNVSYFVDIDYARVTRLGPELLSGATADFNGDGKSDILFQNSSGQVVIWEQSGAAVIASGSAGNPGPSWRVVATGDINTDGLSDILFQNSTGQVVIWEQSGGTVIASGSAGNPGPSWHAVATGDFNADGLSDILFQNSNGDRRPATASFVFERGAVELALDVHFENGRVMDEVVDDSDCHCSVREDLAPFAECTTASIVITVSIWRR